MQAEWERIHALRARVNNEEPQRVIERAKTAFVTSPTHENWERLNALDLNPEMVSERNRCLRRCCNDALRQLTQLNTVPLIVPIYIRLADAADVEANRIEAEDRQRSDDVAIAFEPSAPVLALRQKATNLRSLAEQLQRDTSNNCSPLGLLKEAGIEL